MIKLNFDIDSAIGAHSAWRQYFEAAIEGIDGDKLTDPALYDHTRCVLGAWLHSPEQQPLERLPVFKGLIECHEDFHLLAEKVVSHLHRGDVDAAQAVLCNQFTLASNTLVAHLEELRDCLATATDGAPDQAGPGSS